MPLFLAALLGGLVQIAGSLVGRVLVALGISYVTYSGVDLLVGSLRDMALNMLGSAGPTIVGMLGLFQVGTGLGIVFAAIMARLALAGLQLGTGVLTRQVIK